MAKQALYQGVYVALNCNGNHNNISGKKNSFEGIEGKHDFGRTDVVG